MSMSTPFSGPGAALLWQYGRSFFWFALLGAPVAALLGYAGGMHADLKYSGALLATLCVQMLGADLRSDWGFNSFQWRLPVATRTVVAIELGAALGALLWLLVFYAIAFRISSPQSTFPSPWSIHFMSVIAVAGVLLSKSFEDVDPKVIKRYLGAAALLAVFVYWSPAFLPLPAPVLGMVCILGLGYVAIYHVTRNLRHGGARLNEQFVESLESPDFTEDDDPLYKMEVPREPGGMPATTSLGTKGPVVVAPLRENLDETGGVIHAQPTEDKPFASRAEAETWFVQKTFSLNFLDFVGYSMITTMAFDQFPGDPLVLIPAFLLSLAILCRLAMQRPGPYSAQLPLYQWTRTLTWLRFSWPALAILGPRRPTMLFGLAIFTFVITINPHPAYASLSGAALLFLAAFWIGWVSIAIAPALAPISLLAIAYDLLGEPPVTQFGVILVALYLVSPILVDSALKYEKLLPHGAACIAASLLATAGHFVLPLLSLSTLAHWTGREALGALLILAMLQHHGAKGIIPWDTVRQLRRALLGGVAALWLIILLFGPPDGPEQGITAIYLAFGVVPPLFLPFLIVPYYVKLNARYAT